MKFRLILSIFLLSGTCFLSAQTEVMAWGNITGIRTEGQLMAFESYYNIVEKGWNNMHQTGKERQYRPQYHRDGLMQEVKTNMERIHFIQTVTDVKTGTAKVDISVKSDTAITKEGVYFCVRLPEKYYSEGSIKFGSGKIDLKTLARFLSSKASVTNKINITGNQQSIDLLFAKPVKTFIRKENSPVLYVQLFDGKITKGKQIQHSVTISASGTIDHSPAAIKIDVTNPGRLFDGLGGNFRLQNPAVDPKVIDYNLKNIRVAWGRVEMPWSSWQADEQQNSLSDARKGKINNRVEDAMKMAQRLSAKGMPVIVSDWFPPKWAILGDPEKYERKGGVQAFQLNPAKKEKIYQSITDYLICLKQLYGVEASMFSFNESDLGIDILLTPEEHAEFIKELGAFMAKNGLATKILLGDNSDATTFDFILPAMNDPETHKYIGAVSFHSWRGCDDETLKKWAGAAKRLNVPLIVGEGSTDAAAWAYPEIFNESTFAFYEINLYTRICAICQPLSILQWQLTSDYSLLWGDGVFGSTGELRPTQRFWNLKQLASTPVESFAIPVTCDNENVNCAAFGNIARNEYAVHIVNNGASRNILLDGLPENIHELQIYVTNQKEGMKHYGAIKTSNGKVITDLSELSFVTLTTEKLE